MSKRSVTPTPTAVPMTTATTTVPSAKSEGKKPAIVPVPVTPTSPTTPTSIQSSSASTVNARGGGGGGNTTETEHEHDYPGGADPSIRSTQQPAKLQKSSGRSIFRNRKFNASTDNISLASLSSTMSSASLIIRKIGAVGGGVLGVGRRKSLTGITSIFKKDKDKGGGENGEDVAEGSGSGAASDSFAFKLRAFFSFPLNPLPPFSLAFCSSAKALRSESSRLNRFRCPPPPEVEGINPGVAERGGRTSSSLLGAVVDEGTEEGAGRGTTFTAAVAVGTLVVEAFVPAPPGVGALTLATTLPLPPDGGGAAALFSLTLEP